VEEERVGGLWLKLIKREREKVFILLFVDILWVRYLFSLSVAVKQHAMMRLL